MKKLTDFPKLPEVIKVEVKKGDSGVLLADLPDYDIFTEAEGLNDLFFQVNDLIYTYFDIPKKYQDELSYVPKRKALAQLMIVAQNKKPTTYKKIKVTALYSPQLAKTLTA